MTSLENVQDMYVYKCPCQSIHTETDAPTYIDDIVHVFHSHNKNF